jgi:hypothetical protein
MDPQAWKTDTGIPSGKLRTSSLKSTALNYSLTLTVSQTGPASSIIAAGWPLTPRISTHAENPKAKGERQRDWLWGAASFLDETFKINLRINIYIYLRFLIILLSH